MTSEEMNILLHRIENAVDRAAQAAALPVPALSPDTGLADRHARLRASTQEAITALNSLISAIKAEN